VYLKRYLSGPKAWGMPSPVRVFLDLPRQQPPASPSSAARQQQRGSGNDGECLRRSDSGGSLPVGRPGPEQGSPTWGRAEPRRMNCPSGSSGLCACCWRATAKLGIGTQPGGRRGPGACSPPRRRRPKRQPRNLRLPPTWGCARALPCLQDDALLDDIIDRLLDVRTGRPGKTVSLSETEVRATVTAGAASANSSSKCTNSTGGLHSLDNSPALPGSPLPLPWPAAPTAALLPPPLASGPVCCCRSGSCA
jgi:hypothetical protein